MNPPHESDAARKARVVVAHRSALRELARTTLRYQVHNELASARQKTAQVKASHALAVLALVALSACGGTGGAPAELELLQVEAGDAASGTNAAPDTGDPSSVYLDAAVVDELELDASAVDAGDVVDELELDAGAVDAGEASAPWCYAFQGPTTCAQQVRGGVLTKCEGASGAFPCCCTP